MAAATGEDQAERELPVGERALREAWESRGLSWRRAALAEVIERVVLPLPAGSR